MSVILKEQFSDAFNAYAAEGVALFEGTAPVLSHVCFKFSSAEIYQDYVAAAREIGAVTQEEFKGKQITWCRLNEPLEKGNLRLEWLELVEPKFERNAFNGVTSIGYCVPTLAEAAKLSSADQKMVFRYQSQHAASLVSGA